VIEPLYVAAREVLLDALDALSEQREALILAGAQARELDVAVVLRQVVLFSPEMNLFWCSIGASIAVGLASIPLLEEPLIRA
jgi:hypothetical protein